MKISNVFSAKSGAAAPTVEQLRLAVPSIYAERPADNVSERYGFVSTSRIIDIMQDDDNPTGADKTVTLRHESDYRHHAG